MRRRTQVILDGYGYGRRAQRQELDKIADPKGRSEYTGIADRKGCSEYTGA
jgi:hypothetical protein